MIFREVASNPDNLNFLWSNIFVLFFVFYGGRSGGVGNGIQRGKKMLNISIDMQVKKTIFPQRENNFYLKEYLSKYKWD